MFVIWAWAKDSISRAISRIAGTATAETIDWAEVTPLGLPQVLTVTVRSPTGSSGRVQVI